MRAASAARFRLFGKSMGEVYRMGGRVNHTHERSEDFIPFLATILLFSSCLQFRRLPPVFPSPSPSLLRAAPAKAAHVKGRLSSPPSPVLPPGMPRFPPSLPEAL